MTQQTTGLRFALLTRVSTEAQQARGESLKVQERQIEAAVRQLGGVIVARYAGQEHGMPGHERRIFERMLADAIAETFDAICVMDTSRWSRDNKNSKRGIEIFKCRGIRFFCLTQEFDLNDPQAQFMIGVLSEVYEFAVRQNLKKSAQSRIDRAKKGFVTSGFPPYGRRVDGTNPDGTAKWVIDPDAEQMLIKAVKFYLAGRTWAEVGKILGQHPETIRRRVLAGGENWSQKFKLDGKVITVPCMVPRLVSDADMQAARRKSNAHHINRRTPNVHPLSRYLRCAQCGSVLSVHTHKSDFVWVQHHTKTRTEECFRGIGYSLVERSVLGEFGQALKNTDSIQQAVGAALKSQVEKPELDSVLKEAEKRKERLLTQQQNIVKNLKFVQLDERSPTKRNISKEIEKLDSALTVVSIEIAEISNKQSMINLPTDINDRIKRTVNALVGLNGWAVLKWPREHQRSLVQFLFGDTSLKGRTRAGILRHPEGVYLTKLADGIIKWEARGWFGTLGGAATDFIDTLDHHQDDYRKTLFTYEALNKIALIPGNSSFPDHYTAPQRSIRVKWLNARCITTPLR